MATNKQSDKKLFDYLVDLVIEMYFYQECKDDCS